MRWFLGALAGFILTLPLLVLLLYADVVHIDFCIMCGPSSRGRGEWLISWLLIAGPILGAILVGPGPALRPKLAWFGGLVLLPIAIQMGANGVYAAKQREQAVIRARERAEQDQVALQAALAAFGSAGGNLKTSVVLMAGCGAERLVAVEGPNKQVWYLLDRGAVTAYVDAARLQAVLSPLLPAGSHMTRLAATEDPYVVGFTLAGPAGNRAGEAALVMQQCDLLIQSVKLEGQSRRSYPEFSLTEPPPARDQLKREALRAALAAFPYPEAAVSFGDDRGTSCSGVLVHLSQGEEHAWYWYDNWQRMVTRTVTMARFRELLTPHLPQGARVTGMDPLGNPLAQRVWFTFTLDHQEQMAVALFETEDCRFALKELHLGPEVKPLNIPLD